MKGAKNTKFTNALPAFNFFVSFVFDPSMDAIRFTFTPAQRDYLVTARAFLLRQPLYLLAVFVLGLALALVWLLFAMNATGVDAIVYILPAIITPFGLLTLFLIIAPIVIASQAAKNKTLMSELQWAASDAGLQVAGADTDALLNWDLFNQVIETKNYFLLVFQQRRKLFQMIPKRAFASPQNEARFRALARNKIGDA